MSSPGKGVLDHQVVFNSVDHMGGLYDHIGNAVGCHLIHSFYNIVDLDAVPFQKFFHDHLACPCPVYLIIRKRFGNGVFNGVNGLFTSFVIAGAETYDQNCFFCLAKGRGGADVSRQRQLLNIVFQLSQIFWNWQRHFQDPLAAKTVKELQTGGLLQVGGRQSGFVGKYFRGSSLHKQFSVFQ